MGFEMKFILVNRKENIFVVNLEILTFLFSFYDNERYKAIFFLFFCLFTKQYANYVVETLLKENVNMYVLIYSYFRIPLLRLRNCLRSFSGI